MFTVNDAGGLVGSDIHSLTHSLTHSLRSYPVCVCVTRYRHIYLEKSPPNIARFPYLQSMFKKARRVAFLAILKHPIFVWLSHVSRVESSCSYCGTSRGQVARRRRTPPNPVILFILCQLASLLAFFASNTRSGLHAPLSFSKRTMVRAQTNTFNEELSLSMHVCVCRLWTTSFPCFSDCQRALCCGL